MVKLDERRMCIHAGLGSRVRTFHSNRGFGANACAKQELLFCAKTLRTTESHLYSTVGHRHLLLVHGRPPRRRPPDAPADSPAQGA